LFVMKTRLLADDAIPGWLDRVDGRLERLEKLAQS